MMEELLARVLMETVVLIAGMVIAQLVRRFASRSTTANVAPDEVMAAG